MNFLQDRAEMAAFLATGLIQGLVFWILYSFFNDDMSAPVKASLISAAFLVASWGIVIHFAHNGKNSIKLHVISALTGLVVSIPAFWVWLMQPPRTAGKISSYSGDDFRIFTLPWLFLIVLYVLLPYIQTYQENGRLRFPYTDLFKHSWNNFFIAALALLFTGIYWGLIMLWAGLFSIIGVSFFWDVFISAPFSIITLPTMAGLGVYVARQNDKVILTIRDIALSIFKALTPLLALIALLFLLALPFTGLKPLWDTKSASSLLISLLATMVLFINAVFQDGSRKPSYHGWMRRVVETSLFTMPVFSGIALYSIWLRIGQYGLMPERVYALIFALVLALYSIGYSASVIKKSEVWLGIIQPVNVAVSLLIVILAVLLHTPLLDPLSISASNQYKRLVQGLADAESFDFAALRFKLGQYGHEKLQEIAAQSGLPKPDVVKARTQRAFEAAFYVAPKKAQEIELKEEHIKVLTPGKLPDGLIRGIAEWQGGWAEECAKKKKCALFSINLDDDEEDEYVLSPYGESYSLYLFDRVESGWKMAGYLMATKKVIRKTKNLEEEIKSGPVVAVPPRFKYKNLVISDEEFAISGNNVD